MKNKSKAKKTALIILAVLLILVLLAVSVFTVLYFNGKHKFHKNDKNISVGENDAVEVSDEDVYYKDKTYVLDNDVVSILFMGVDKEKIDDNLGYSKNGQADSIFVAAINTREKTTKIIPISRETMVDMDIYSVGGSFSKVEKQQLCLAYDYGNTSEESSKNVMRSVSRLLYGINISSFVTVDLNGVKTISNAVGGVKVTALESMQLPSKSITQGSEVLLKGEDAVQYIRTRGGDLEANNRRMLRQKQFLSAFASTAGNQIMSNFTKLAAYYNLMSPYVSTNVSLSQATYLAGECLTADIGSKFEYKVITGQMQLGEKWAEFIPDTDAVLDIVMDVFYKVKQ